MECPKCQFENPADSNFCSKCGTQFLPSEEISVSHTKILETPKEELTTDSTFAGRYQIIEELGKAGMGKVYKVLDKEISSDIDKEVGKITTSSPEAYKYYSEGRKYLNKGEERKSIQFMERAVEIEKPG